MSTEAQEQESAPRPPPRPVRPNPLRHRTLKRLWKMAKSGMPLKKWARAQPGSSRAGTLAAAWLHSKAKRTLNSRKAHHPRISKKKVTEKPAAK